MRLLRYLSVLLFVGMGGLFAPAASVAAVGFFPVGEDFASTGGAAGSYKIKMPVAGAAYYPQIDFWKHAFLDELTGSSSDPAFLEDLMRIQYLVQQPASFYQRLKEFNVRVAAVKAAHGGYDDWQALEHALSDLEASHLFPAARLAAIKILPSDVYVTLPKRGFILADVGAGLLHGELTHRLQWAALIMEFEADPTVWNYTPLELFIKIGVFDSLPGADRRSLWSHLFDQAGRGMRESGGSFFASNDPWLPDGFRHPDRLTLELGIQAGASVPAGLGTISSGVSQRYRQRLVAVNREVDAQNKDFYADLMGREDLQQAAYQKLTASLTGQFVVINELLVHKDDVQDYNKENDTTTSLRMALSRLKWKGDTSSSELKSLNKISATKYPRDLVATVKGMKKSKSSYDPATIVGARFSPFILPGPDAAELAEMGALGPNPLPKSKK